MGGLLRACRFKAVRSPGREADPTISRLHDLTNSSPKFPLKISTSRGRSGGGMGLFALWGLRSMAHNVAMYATR